MDTITIANAIEERINKLEALSEELPRLADEKARTLALYEQKLKEEIEKLRDTTPTTYIEKIARGNVHDYCQAKDRAESALKIQFKVIDVVQAQLNGYQSINRHLDKL